MSPATRTEALLLDEAFARVALLNEVSQSGHILMDLGIPGDCNFQVNSEKKTNVAYQPWYSLLSRSVCSWTSKIKNSPPTASTSTTALGS